jgi:hypothetical protein
MRPTLEEYGTDWEALSREPSRSLSNPQRKAVKPCPGRWWMKI